MSVTTEDIVNTADILKEMMLYILSRSKRTALSPAPTILFVFDRTTHVIPTPTASVHIFEVDDHSALSLCDLDQNYFVGMEMMTRIETTSEAMASPSHRVQCWLRFGMKQRVRFVPEHLLWIVPALFARSSTMKPYDFWYKLYGDDYKHRWSVSLKDDILSKFHHILTGNVLCSVNYRRDEVDEAQQVQVDGLRDHLERTLETVLMEKMETLISGQRYDSDAVVEDVMAIVMERKRVNDTDSNICRNLKSREWHQLKYEVMKYLNVRCDVDDKRAVTDCVLIEELIQNLIRFEQFGLEIDASNLFEFALSSLVKGLGHLYRVHEYGVTSGPKRQSIRRHVLERIQCNLGAQCPAVQQHGERKRENDNRRPKLQKESKQQDDEVSDRGGQNDEVETLCEALRDTLCAAHCYLLHADDELYRLRAGAAELRFATEVVETKQKENQMKNDREDAVEDKERVKEPLSINFGESVLEWLSFTDPPRFGSLREELIHNDNSTLDQDLLDRMTVQCRDGRNS